MEQIAKRGFWALPGLVLALWLGSCATPPRDLVLNEDLYMLSGYRSFHRQPRAVYVAPLVDRRVPTQTFDSNTYPATYTEDDFWARPIPKMLSELIQLEVGSSGLFERIVASESEADWVLQPILIAFHGVIEERVVGRHTKGLTLLRLRVLGDRGPDGKRRLIREGKFEAPVDGTTSFVFSNPYALAAASFRKAMGMMLADLDHGGRMVDRVPREEDFSRPKEIPWAQERGVGSNQQAKNARDKSR